MSGTLAVVAHFDPAGQVAGHVDRYLAQLAGSVDRLVVVSTAPLTDAARRTLEGHGDLVTRPNVGYDFASWKAGLAAAEPWDGFDRVLVTNDSVVGPMLPLGLILGEAAPRDVDFWGMTSSGEHSPHVQSWFVVFERPVIRSGLLHGFWRALEPVSDRYVVVRRYEVGLSRLLLAGGFTMGSWFRPTPLDAARARVRLRRALRQMPERQRAALAATRSTWRRPQWNPTYVLWDAVLDRRLPFVKLEVLRDDPYRFGRERMLARLERAFPEQMDGVSAFLDRTRADMQRLRGVPGAGAPGASRG